MHCKLNFQTKSAKVCQLFNLKSDQYQISPVISTLYKTEWSRELRTGSDTMNWLDSLTISPYYFYRKCIRATYENLNFVVRVSKVNRHPPVLPLIQPCTLASDRN